MSAELQMSSTESVDFPYRALSRAAVVSIIFSVLALPGLVPVFAPMLGMSLVGIVAAMFALRAIGRFPDEFGGLSLARFGLAANVLLLAAGVGLHTYIYMTEVPDGYTRVRFFELQPPVGAPDGPTQRAVDIDGQPVFLKGYIHPASGSGLLRQFILVPDLGTCCFGGQPKSSDMIEVTLMRGQTTKAGLIKKKLAGKFTVNRAPQKVTGIDSKIFYQMRVEQIR